MVKPPWAAAPLTARLTLVGLGSPGSGLGAPQGCRTRNETLRLALRGQGVSRELAQLALDEDETPGGNSADPIASPLLHSLQIIKIHAREWNVGKALSGFTNRGFGP